MTVVPFSPEPRRRAAPFASWLTNVNNAAYDTGYDDDDNMVVHARDLEGVVIEVENAAPASSTTQEIDVRIWGNLPDVAESALPTIGTGSWVPVQAEDAIDEGTAKAYTDSRRFSWYAIQLKRGGTAASEAQVTVRGY